jgi:hypothetical protein
MARLRRIQASEVGPSLEDRQDNRRTDTVVRAVAGEPVGELGTLQAALACDRESRKEVGASLSDTGIGGHERGFCLENVRAPFQKLRREPNRNVRLSDDGTEGFAVKIKRSRRHRGQHLQPMRFHGPSSRQVRNKPCRFGASHFRAFHVQLGGQAD